MTHRTLFISAACLMLAVTAGAADVSLHGRLYGAVNNDFAGGEVKANAPTGLPPELGGNEPPVEGDGDPAYNFRYHADVGIRAAFNDRVGGNIEFTFDDRKKPGLYRYEMLRDGFGDVYLIEHPQDSLVWASLEEVNVDVAAAVSQTDLTFGGFDIRYGHGGYFNGLLNHFEPTSFVAYLDPFGIRVERRFGRLAATLDVGASLNRQPIIATSQNLGTFTFFAATEGRRYDLYTLWQTHYLAALPKYWRYYEVQVDEIVTAPLTADGRLGDTLHAGVENSWRYKRFSAYAVAAFHRFADAPGITEARSGGFLIQVYPDVEINVVPERVVFRSGVVYEYWFSNAATAFGTTPWNDNFVAFGEPAYYLTPDLMVGVGGRLWEPGRKTGDDELTPLFREDKGLNVAALPHIRYTPTAGVTVDLTYQYARWDYPMDDPATPDRDDVNQELKLEVETVF